MEKRPSRMNSVAIILLSLASLGWAIDVGNWTVGDCLRTEFAMNLSIDLRNTTDFNETLSVAVPSQAKVDASQANCGKNREILKLTWTETSKNGTVLARNITFNFDQVNDTE